MHTVVDYLEAPRFGCFFDLLEDVGAVVCGGRIEEVNEWIEAVVVVVMEGE